MPPRGGDQYVRRMQSGVPTRPPACANKFAATLKPESLTFVMWYSFRASAIYLARESTLSTSSSTPIDVAMPSRHSFQALKVSRSADSFGHDRQRHAAVTNG